MRRAAQAFAAYAAVALVATWPLARGLTRNVASDFGDPVLVMWALAWDCEQLLRILHGEFARVSTFFDANIFYPSTLTLAYSEHFLAQAVQVLPIYAVTHNPILSYNLLLLSTFALSGLGGYLFTRELTGSDAAGFIGGLLFAFAPYRIPQAPHLQVLSSQWMPFALYGLRRFFTTAPGRAGRTLQGGRWRPLAGATAALVAQYLSCTYYLLYFSPFVAGYVVWEVAARRLWRDWRMWRQLATAGVAVAICTLPFVLPYFAVQQMLGVERSRQEVMRYSADVHSYLTAFDEQPIWGRVANGYHKPEGDLFPGLITPLLAMLGVIAAFVSTGSAARARSARAEGLRGALPPMFALLAALHLMAAVAVLLLRRINLDLWLFTLRMSNVDQLLLRAVIAFVLLLVFSPPARTRTAAFMRGPGFFLVAAAAAAWLSLGPSPQTLGRPIELAGPYAFLMEHVPGFQGVRAPARFGMIVVLMLSTLAAYGVAWMIGGWWRGPRQVALISILGVLFLAESLALPFDVNKLDAPAGFTAPEPRLPPLRAAPSIYSRIRDLPATAAIAELPLGIPEFDRRAMYFSLIHWHPLLNGYSGFFPPYYGQLTVATSDIPRHPDAALSALRGGRATHVVVHEAAYLAGDGLKTTAALKERGAVELDRDGADVLLALPR